MTTDPVVDELVKRVVDGFEWLEGMYGPDSVEQYVQVLTAVQKELATRICNAVVVTKRLEEGSK